MTFAELFACSGGGIKMKNNKKTTISISEDTKISLDMMGKKGESYDRIIQKIISKYRPDI